MIASTQLVPRNPPCPPYYENTKYSAEPKILFGRTLPVAMTRINLQLSICGGKKGRHVAFFPVGF